MLWVSRMPFVLAREHYLPAPLTRLWSATATPTRSILLCCIVFTLLVPVGFVALVVLDVFFYMAALTLEMVAMVRLRQLAPVRVRMFPGGRGRLGPATAATRPVLTLLPT